MRPIDALFTLTWRVSSAILEPSSAQTNNALIVNGSFFSKDFTIIDVIVKFHGFNNRKVDYKSN